MLFSHLPSTFKLSPSSSLLLLYISFLLLASPVLVQALIASLVCSLPYCSSYLQSSTFYSSIAAGSTYIIFSVWNPSMVVCSVQSYLDSLTLKAFFHDLVSACLTSSLSTPFVVFMLKYLKYLKNRHAFFYLSTYAPAFPPVQNTLTSLLHQTIPAKLSKLITEDIFLRSLSLSPNPVFISVVPGISSICIISENF